MRKLPVWIAVCLSLHQLAFAQGNVAATQDTIPFTLTAYNNIAVEAILNDADTLRLMLHTAASAVTLTEDAIANLTNIDFNTQDTVSSWGGAQTARHSPHNRLQIGSLTWTDMPIWENKHSGRMTDGKFGLDLFEGNVIEINFDQHYLVIHPSLPELGDQYEKVPIIFEHGFMFLKGGCAMPDTMLENKFLLHSGYSGALLCDDEFAQHNMLNEKLKTISESVLKDSYGNELKTIYAVLPSLHIGAREFREIPIGFFDGVIGRQKMSVLGGDILKRFNMVIDRQNKALYLHPNSLKEVAYFHTH